MRRLLVLVLFVLGIPFSVHAQEAVPDAVAGEFVKFWINSDPIEGQEYIPGQIFSLTIRYEASDQLGHTETKVIPGEGLKLTGCRRQFHGTGHCQVLPDGNGNLVTENPFGTGGTPEGDLATFWFEVQEVSEPRTVPVILMFQNANQWTDVNGDSYSDIITEGTAVAIKPAEKSFLSIIMSWLE